VVFDGSMKTTTGVSLNDQLLVGPTVHPPLNDVLIRFRQHPYVLTTDVSKMYRAVALAPEDRDFHRFLWREKATDPVVDYRMTRVTFGIASAPFLATNSVLHLAEQNESELPLGAKAVKESMMVFSQSKPNKKPFYFIINFKTTLTEEGSNFTNGTQTRLKF